VPGDINYVNYDEEFPKYLINSDYPFYPNATTDFANNNTVRNAAGKYEWMQGDNEENFNKNKERAPSDWKYLSKPVTYTINSVGYRAPEWDQIDWKNSIVLFGCSCTYGIGVSDEETIAAQLEKLSGRPVINLGVPGGSNSLMIQNATRLLDYFTAPYAVANIWSTSDRFEFFMKDRCHHTGPWDIIEHKISEFTSVSKLWKYTFADPNHEMALAHYEGKIGKWLWQGRSKYASTSFFPGTVKFTQSEIHIPIDNTARDLQHPGEGSFKEMAEYLHEKFK
jgi:hypothetical protein